MGRRGSLALLLAGGGLGGSSAGAGAQKSSADGNAGASEDAGCGTSRGGGWEITRLIAAAQVDLQAQLTEEERTRSTRGADKEKAEAEIGGEI